MCLTEAGYRERKWGSFPALRKALEDKEIPSEYFGLTTADDNIFESFPRLVEIVVVAHKYQKTIMETVQAIGPDQTYRDLSLDHLKLTFVAEKPPPEGALQDLPMVADPPVDYFS